QFAGDAAGPRCDRALSSRRQKAKGRRAEVMATRDFARRIALAVGVVGCLSAAPLAQRTAKAPLTHADYDGWRGIYTPTLARDGRYLAYSFMPQEGDGELVVRDLKTGQERRPVVGR